MGNGYWRADKKRCVRFQRKKPDDLKPEFDADSRGQLIHEVERQAVTVCAVWRCRDRDEDGFCLLEAKPLSDGVSSPFEASREDMSAHGRESLCVSCR